MFSQLSFKLLAVSTILASINICYDYYYKQKEVIRHHLAQNKNKLLCTSIDTVKYLEPFCRLVGNEKNGC